MSQHHGWPLAKQAQQDGTILWLLARIVHCVMLEIKLFLKPLSRFTRVSSCNLNIRKYFCDNSKIACHLCYPILELRKLTALMKMKTKKMKNVGKFHEFILNKIHHLLTKLRSVKAARQMALLMFLRVNMGLACVSVHTQHVNPKRT